MRLIVHTDLLHTPCFPYEQEAWIELLQQLGAGNYNVKVLLLQRNAPSGNMGTHIQHIPVFPRQKNLLFWRFFYSIRLPFIMRRLRPDFFISLSATPVSVKLMRQFLYLPDTSCSASGIQRYINKQRNLDPGQHRHFTGAASVAAATVSHYKVPPYIPAAFTALTQEAKDAVKAQYTNGAEYFLYMGPLCAQANLLQLLRAFSQFKKWQTSSMKLVLCGPDYWSRNGFATLLATYKHRNDVVVVGEIPFTEAAPLTGAAYALVQPFAGNGPSASALAAVQAAVPAIVVRTPANETAGGNAFLYAEHEGVEELAAKLMLLYKDETLRSRLIRNGKEQGATALPHPAVQQLAALLQASVSK